MARLTIDPVPLTILYSEDEGQVVARIREVPSAMSHGATREEARESVLDALRELVLSYLEDGSETVPVSEVERFAVYAETR